jgi:DNA-binding transcriptional MerR regulator
MSALLIGELAKRTRLTPATIRYYETLGLLSQPARSDAGYRRYSESTLEEIGFIKKAQGLGFTLDEVREILGLSRRGQTPCAHVLELSKRHLHAVEERIAQFIHFRDQLKADIKHWEKQKQTYCKGVCQWIASAPVRTPPPGLHTNNPAPARRAPRARPRP